jgi:oligoribonuclease
MNLSVKSLFTPGNYSKISQILRAKMSSVSEKNMIWVDLEMTGLELDKHTIIEAACLITDDELNTIAEGPNIVIHHPDDVLANMNEWCINQFAISGLTEESRKSKVSLAEAETQLVDFISKYTPKGACPLAGNTVHMDKRFLEKCMPKFAEHLHYRIVDVSTVKELCRRWYPAEFAKMPRKKNSHRALDDIKESIDELKHYRSLIFKQKV